MSHAEGEMLPNQVPMTGIAVTRNVLATATGCCLCTGAEEAKLDATPMGGSARRTPE